MVKFNLSSATLFSLLAFAVHSSAQNLDSRDQEFADFATREPGLFSVLKKIPVVGGLFGRDIDAFENISVRELTEVVVIAARDNQAVAALVARDPFFQVLGARDYDELHELSMRELAEAVELASREDPDAEHIVRRSPFLGSLLRKIPVVGSIFGRSSIHDSGLEARMLALDELDELE